MIVCVGDSITYGQHLTDRTKPWPRLLDYDNVISVGVPGDTTRLGLERFPKDVQAYEPDTVIIQFGHNDCNRWDTDRGLPRVSDRAFMANLEEMVDRCRTFGATPYLCTLTPSVRSEQHAVDTIRYDEIIRQVAEASMTSLIDVRPEFMPSLSFFLMDDGLHLTEAGHQMYADVVQRTLDE